MGELFNREVRKIYEKYALPGEFATEIIEGNSNILRDRGYLILDNFEEGYLCGVQIHNSKNKDLSVFAITSSLQPDYKRLTIEKALKTLEEAGNRYKPNLLNAAFFEAKETKYTEEDMIKFGRIIYATDPNFMGLSEGIPLMIKQHLEVPDATVDLKCKQKDKFNKFIWRKQTEGLIPELTDF